MPDLSAARESDLLQAANALLDARRTGVLLPDLPESLRPTTMDEVYFIQQTVAEASGPVGGYKVGAPNPEATPTFAPMPLAWIAPAGALLSGDRWRYRGLEAEIAFQLAHDMPPRAASYSREEALAAVATCHPVLEVLESSFEDPAAATRLSVLADLQSHGSLIYGPAVAAWQTIDWTKETVALAVDGTIRVERIGSNTSGDLLGLIPWLANHATQHTGGLRAGQWITTGSWTGNTLAMAGSSADAHFNNAGRVTLRFAPAGS